MSIKSCGWHRSIEINGLPRGILAITSTDKSNTINDAKITVKGVNQSTSSNERIFIKDARKYRQQDDKEVKRMKAYANLYMLVQSVGNALGKRTGYTQLTELIDSYLTKSTNDMEEWLQEQKEQATFETFTSKRAQLELKAEILLKGHWRS